MFNLIQNWFKRYFSDPQIIILVFLLLIGFLATLFLGAMLTPVFISIIIAYLLEGVVQWLERLKIRRQFSALLVSLLFMACLILTVVSLLPFLTKQVTLFIQELPRMLTKIQALVVTLFEENPNLMQTLNIDSFLQGLTTEVTNQGQMLLSFSRAGIESLVSIVIYLVLVPLMVFFFLKDKSAILNWIKSFLPEERYLTTMVWHEVNQQISNYVRGKIWEILIVWSVSYITFVLLKLKYALLISIFVGLSVLFPYIGATIMVFPIALVAFFQWGLVAESAYVVIAYSIIQALDGNLLAPLLLSEVVNLHPVAIIVSILVFGELWGFWGLFLAIPLATLVHAVIKAWKGIVSNYPKDEIMVSKK